MDSQSETPTGAPVVAPASRGASRIWLVVLPLVTLALGFAIGSWIARPRAATGSPESAAPAAEPSTQRGTVKLEGLPTGTVYYPIPFASPPHLELKPSARFLILKQDEAGFTWADRARVKDVAELANQFPELAKAASGADKPEGPPPDLEWEATGPRAAHAGFPRTFAQKGRFESQPGAEGVVYFPLPYASPPNVEFTSLPEVIVTECTRLGFHWSAPASSRSTSTKTVDWTARGVRATVDDLRSSPLRAAEPEIVRLTGKFTSVGKDSGEVYFTIPFVAPPNVEVFVESSWHELVPSRQIQVTECKSDHFRWANTQSDGTVYTWVAKGRRGTPPAAGP
jgi:hypothetical protein